jgi:SnoaL-like polyketide cyclase
MATRAETMQRYLEIWNGTRDLAELDGLVTHTFVGHMGFRDRGLSQLKEDIRAYREHAGDVRFEVMHRFGEGDHVATRVVAHVMDPGTGSEVSICGMNISRWEDGLLAEEWAVWEALPGS